MELKKQIPLSMAITIISTFAIVVFVSSWYIYSRWMQPDTRNVFEHQIDVLKAKQNSDDPKIKLDIAMSQYLDGQTEQANKTFLDVLKSQPLNSQALFYLGLISADQKNYKEAEKYLESALKADKRLLNKQLSYYLGLSYLEDNKTDKAVTYLKYAVELDPASAEANYLLGLAYFRTNNGRLAEPYLVRAFEINGNPKAASVLTQIQSKHRLTNGINK